MRRGWAKQPMARIVAQAVRRRGAEVGDDGSGRGGGEIAGGRRDGDRDKDVDLVEFK